MIDHYNYVIFMYIISLRLSYMQRLITDTYIYILYRLTRDIIKLIINLKKTANIKTKPNQTNPI